MKYGIFIIGLLLSFSCIAQVSPEDSVHSDNVEKQANEMAQLLVKKDYENFTKFTHPAIIKMAGGPGKMVELLKTSMADMETEGFSILNCTITKPAKIIHYQNELQCIVGQTIEMTVPDGKMVTKSSLIGISTDKGATWTFIETQGKALKEIKPRFPNLSPDLVIPPKEEPVVYKN